MTARVERYNGRNPVGVVTGCLRETQGSSCLATLGCGAQSRWDWKKLNANVALISTSLFKLFRFPAGVKNGENNNAIRLDQKMDHKRKTTQNNCPANFAQNLGEPFRMGSNPLKVFFDGETKFTTEPRLAALIPSNRFVKFHLRNPAEDKAPFHFPYFASSLALTSSKETTSSGWSRWSWRRRVINSASPGVSSCDSTISSQRLRQSSICSARGSARASLRTISELMTLIYRAGASVQAGFSTAHPPHCMPFKP